MVPVSGLSEKQRETVLQWNMNENVRNVTGTISSRQDQLSCSLNETCYEPHVSECF